MASTLTYRRNGTTPIASSAGNDRSAAMVNGFFPGVGVGGLLKSAKISFCQTGGGEEFGIEAWRLGPGDLPFEHQDFAVRVV